MDVWLAGLIRVGRVPGGDYADKGRGLDWAPSDSPLPAVVANPQSRFPMAESGGVAATLTGLVRVEHDTSGGAGKSPDYSAGEVTDRPCPAITIGVGGLNSRHRLATDGSVGGVIRGDPLTVEADFGAGRRTYWGRLVGRELTLMDSPTKPPYRVPLVAEIAALPWNGFTAASTFSGCGGSSLGYKMAGFKVLWASEFVPAAQQVYRLNHPGTVLDPRDVREVTGKDVCKAAGVGVGELDVFDGSPPCASFSTAGKREAGWGKIRKYCVDPDTPVLMKTLRSCRAGDVKTGDQVVAFEESGEPGTKGRRFRTATVTGCDRIVRPCVRVKTDDGADVTCSSEHRWLVVSGRNLRWKTADSIAVGDQLLSLGRWVESRTWEAGYLAGIFDGEGCASAGTKTRTKTLGAAQKPGPVMDRIRDHVAAFGFTVGGSDRADQCGVANINGGLPERLRFLGTIRPERLVAKAERLWDGVNVGAAKKVSVVAVERVGDREVIALSTDQKTFIADGLLSHNSDTAQRTDDLFDQYVRLVREVRPRTFVAENVSGLVKGTAKGYFLHVLAAMKAAGYAVCCRVLDAQWLGVPQARQRTIFVGVRNDLVAGLGLDVNAVHPAPLPYRYSVREAIPWIVSVEVRNGKFEPAGIPARTIRQSDGSRSSTSLEIDTGYVEAIPPELRLPPSRQGQNPFNMSDVDPAAPCPTVTVSSPGNDLRVPVNAPPPGDGPPLAGYAVGAEWDRLKPGESSDKYLNLSRPHPDAPCPTVTASGGPSSTASVTHPVERRKFTIAELIRICGFPDDFKLTGSYEQQWERLGRAVPPPMMAAVAAAVRDRVLAPARAKGLI